MTATQQKPTPSTASRVHDFQARLQDETAKTPWVELLFMSHSVTNVTADVVERKKGTDFFLTPYGSTACIRMENKFETMATGRLALEFVSVDRPRLTPGWMFTSHTAWLLSWFPSGDLIALPMSQLRERLLDTPARHQATTARNPRYMSWNALEDINWLMQNIPDARALDLRQELGLPFERKSMLWGASRKKVCTVDQFLELAVARPTFSTPVAPTEEQLVSLMRQIQAKNRMKDDPLHASFISELACLA